MKKFTIILLTFLLILSTAPISMAAVPTVGPASKSIQPTLHDRDSLDSASTPTVERYSSIIDEESSHQTGTGTEESEKSVQTKKNPKDDSENVADLGRDPLENDINAKNSVDGNGTASSAKQHVTSEQDQVTADELSRPSGKGKTSNQDASKQDQASNSDSSKSYKLPKGTSQQGSASDDRTASKGDDAASEGDVTKRDEAASDGAASEQDDASTDSAASKRDVASIGDDSAKQDSASTNGTASKQDNTFVEDASRKQDNASPDGAASKRDVASIGDDSAKQDSASTNGTASKQDNTFVEDASRKQDNVSTNDAVSKRDDASAKQDNATTEGAASNQGGISSDEASDTLEKAAHNEDVRKESSTPKKSRLDQFIEKNGFFPKVSYLFAEFGKWLEDLVDEVV